MRTDIKRAIIATIVVVLLFGVVVGLNYYRAYKSIVREVDRHLSDSDRKVYEDRLAGLDQKLTESPDDNTKFDLYMQKGFNLYGLGKLSGAQDYYNKAVKLRPEDPNSFVALYEARLEMQDNRGAEDAIKKAIDLRSYEPDFWKKYITLKKDRFGASTEDLKKLYAEGLYKTSGVSNKVDLIAVYAQFLESIGDLAGAQAQWQAAINANGNNAAAYQAEIGRLQKLIDQK